ncbi:hypothetical protein JCM6882_000503 [Rhodosporidiobolus microsporus]
MSAILGLGEGIPIWAEWITPQFEMVLKRIQDGESPYLFFIHTLDGLFRPSVPRGFRTQLAVATAFFGFACAIILAGLLVRITSGRFWLFHRLDRTIILPNTSTIYGVCSLVYTSLGIVVADCAIRSSRGDPIPPYYIGLRAAWMAPLWTGIYCECWATLCGWYIRKNGAFYKQSALKSAVAIVLPFFLLLAAWIPPLVLFYLAAHDYNASYRFATSLSNSLRALEATWTPSDGLEMDELLRLFGPGANVAKHLVRYSERSRIGYGYCGGVLLCTFLLYIVGAWLEISHLSRTATQLRKQALAQGAPPPRQPTLCERTSKRFSTKIRQVVAPSPPLSGTVIAPALSVDLMQQLDEEHFARADGRTAAVQHPWTLLSWARRNRIWSAVCISTMLLVNAGLDIWQAATRLNLQMSTQQFQVETLVSCWLNGILCTIVAFLLLFRSLDATSSPFLSALRKHLPFLPFPPPVASAVRSHITTEPPRFTHHGANNALQLVERTATSSPVEASRPIDDGVEEVLVPISLPYEAPRWGGADEEGKADFSRWRESQSSGKS